MHGIKEKCIQGFGGKIQRKQFEDLGIDVMINTTRLLNNTGRYGMDSSSSGYVQMAG
jgi:hypothetical protein